LPSTALCLLTLSAARSTVLASRTTLSQRPLSAQQIVRCFYLVLLALVRAHVAAAIVLLVGTRPAALIGLQQMTMAISTATGIARINRWASREQSLDLGRGRRLESCDLRAACASGAGLAKLPPSVRSVPAATPVMVPVEVGEIPLTPGSPPKQASSQGDRCASTTGASTALRAWPASFSSAASSPGGGPTPRLFLPARHTARDGCSSPARARASALPPECDGR
jgi:hypothetical protein